MAEFDNLSSSIPPYSRERQALVDTLETATSKAQEATLKECLPLLNGITDPKRNPFDFNEFGIPTLERENHIAFLHENLAEFPAPFVGIDASRPWMVYWGLFALYMLGEDTTPFRARYFI